jgi:hypothetical protein
MVKKGTLIFKEEEPVVLRLKETPFALSFAEGEKATLVFSGLVYGGGSPYEGAYTVTPILEDSIELPTKGKVADDDITVLKIPQYEVTNEAGGITFIIGENEIAGG